MERLDITILINKFVQDYFLKGKEIALDGDTSFLEKGIIDSTGVMELVSFLETNFNIVVEDWEIVPENLESINRISDFIIKKLAGSTPLRPL
jgi:acyl carrier protein